MTEETSNENLTRILKCLINEINEEKGRYYGDTLWKEIFITNLDIPYKLKETLFGEHKHIWKDDPKEPYSSKSICTICGYIEYEFPPEEHLWSDGTIKKDRLTCNKEHI